VFAQGAAADAPLAAIDVAPPALPPATWAALINYVLHGSEHEAQRIADRLSQWRDARVAIALDGSALVVEASGDRR
jgi:hypothetical protein